jgi:hypothetical protein
MQVRVLVINEISMVEDNIGPLGSNGRETLNANLPFGGVQIILCLQLPPISGTFSLKSQAWKSAIKPQACFELSFAYRKGNDQLFAQLLDNVRRGKVDEETLRQLNRAKYCKHDRHSD